MENFACPWLPALLKFTTVNQIPSIKFEHQTNNERGAVFKASSREHNSCLVIERMALTQLPWQFASARASSVARSHTDHVFMQCRKYTAVIALIDKKTAFFWKFTEYRSGHDREKENKTKPTIKFEEFIGRIHLTSVSDFYLIFFFFFFFF